MISLLRDLKWHLNPNAIRFAGSLNMTESTFVYEILPIRRFHGQRKIAVRSHYFSDTLHQRPITADGAGTRIILIGREILICETGDFGKCLTYPCKKLSSELTRTPASEFLVCLVECFPIKTQLKGVTTFTRLSRTSQVACLSR
jgi:hypothetical protein